MSFLIALKNALPMLAVIFCIVLLLLLLARFIAILVVNHMMKTYRQIRKISSSVVLKVQGKDKKESDKKEDETLLRYIPKSNSQLKAEARAAKMGAGQYELMESEQQQLDKHEMQEVKIVGVVKPIGFWTSMILGQKLTYLINSAHILNKRSNKGFWVSMIEAKDRTAGRQHGRMR